MTPTEQARPTDAEFDGLIATAHRSIHREMRRGRRRRGRRALTGGLVALAVAGGGAAVASQIDRPAPSPFPPGTFAAGPTAPPKPGDDLEIGPWTRDQAPPDLVSIDLEDGRSGYLRTYDLANGSQNPEFQRKRGRWTDTVLPVYAKDGQTVIGEFVGGSSR